MDIAIYICGSFVAIGSLWMGYLGAAGHLKDQKLLALWVLYGTLISVLTGAFLFFHQRVSNADASARSAEIARQAAEAQRTSLSSRPELFMEHTTPDPIAAGKRVTMRMIVRNRGSLTAHKIKIAAMHALFKSSFTGPLQYHQANPPDISPSIGVSASYEFISVSPWTVTKAQIVDLRDGNIRLFHYGKGTYEDKRGKEFVFQFCAMFEPLVKTMVMCPDKYVPVSLSEEPKQPYLVVESAAVNLIAGEQVEMYVVLGNQGSEAATSLWLEGVTTVKKRSFQGPLEPKGMTRTDIPINLAPETRTTATLREPKQWSRQVVADIKNEKYLLFHYGRGEYGDAAGNVYRIQYCLRYERSPAKTVQRFSYMGMCEMKFWPKYEEDNEAET
jgi:hypothetical protein